MKTRLMMAVLATACICGLGCKRENIEKDRTQADEMFLRICELTKEYTAKLEEAPDSTDWAETCSEFEEKLDKISFSYPPDTDILLTEGQNDTIYILMREYVKARSRRIRGLLYPEAENDSIIGADSITAISQDAVVNGG